MGNITPEYPTTIISRERAKQLGHKYYFTGKECKHGHLTAKYTATSVCVGCMGIRNKDRYEKSSTVRISKKAERAAQKASRAQENLQLSEANIVRAVTRMRSGTCIDAYEDEVIRRYERAKYSQADKLDTCRGWLAASRNVRRKASM